MFREIGNILSGKLENTAAEQRVLAFLVFMGVLSVTFSILFVIDFLPEAPVEDGALAEETTIVEETTAPAASVLPEEAEMLAGSPLPTKIFFDSLDREVAVLNPASASVAALDNALLSGVVRHPESADLSENGTMFLFGHSSYLPVVHNKNFQAFNGVQNLKWGDTIRVQSADNEYVYRVDRVYQVKASAAEIDIEYGKAKLTLVTCNSFGSKDDRHVVEATLIDSYAI